MTPFSTSHFGPKSVVIRRRDLYAILINIWTVGLFASYNIEPLWYGLMVFVFVGLWLLTHTRKGAIRDQEGQ